MKRTDLVVRAILVLLTVGGFHALVARSAQAATVFNNYTGSNCRCGFGHGFYAEEFSPTSDSDFTGAAAFVLNTDIASPQSFSMALLSSTSEGVPGSSLWTSGTLTAPGGDDIATFVAQGYAGSPILLQTGNEYFLVLNISGSDPPQWLEDGSSSTLAFGSGDGTSWNNLGEESLQFEILGAVPGAGIIPEPAPWAMLLLGFAGLAFAGYRGREALARA